MGIIYDCEGNIMGYVSSYEEKCFNAAITDEEYHSTWADSLGNPFGNSASTVTGVLNGVYTYNGISLDTSLVNKLEIKDNEVLKEEDRENVDMRILGLTVDYMTRLALAKDNRNEIIFHTAIDGLHKYCDIYYKRDNLARERMMNRLSDYMRNIKDVEAFSVECAYNLARFDACHRNMPMNFDPSAVMLPLDVIRNMKVMINRTIKFIDTIGPVIGCGVGLSSNGKFDVDYAEVDYITDSCLIDLKVLSSKKLEFKHILQLLAYYILGKETYRKEFKHINKIMVFNPRYNTAHILKLSDVSEELIQSVKDNILNYKKANTKKIKEGQEK